MYLSCSYSNWVSSWWVAMLFCFRDSFFSFCTFYSFSKLLILCSTSKICFLMDSKHECWLVSHLLRTASQTLHCISPFGHSFLKCCSICCSDCRDWPHPSGQLRRRPRHVDACYLTNLLYFIDTLFCEHPPVPFGPLHTTSKSSSNFCKSRVGSLNLSVFLHFRQAKIGVVLRH